MWKSDTLIPGRSNPRRKFVRAFELIDKFAPEFSVATVILVTSDGSMHLSRKASIRLRVDQVGIDIEQEITYMFVDRSSLSFKPVSTLADFKEAREFFGCLE